MDRINRVEKPLRAERDLAVAQAQRLRDRVLAAVEGEPMPQQITNGYHAGEWDEENSGVRMGGVEVELPVVWPAHLAETLAETVEEFATIKLDVRDDGAMGTVLTTPAMQRILDSLAWLEAEGVSPAPRLLVLLLSGYKHPNSKGFVEAMKALGDAGYVTAGGGMVTLTDTGRSGATLFLGGVGLAQRIVGLLDAVPARILHSLAAVWPQSVERASLVGWSGYAHPNSHGFVDAMSKLRELGLVELPQAGYVRAAAMLFPRSRVTVPAMALDDAGG